MFGSPVLLKWLKAARRLASDDVAGQHRGNEIVEEMQVRAADRTARHLDAGIAVLLDLGIRDRVAPDVFLTVPNERRSCLRDAVRASTSALACGC
jgi:hypothetical protein